MRTDQHHLLKLLFLSEGVVSATDISRKLGVSQPTVSRLIREDRTIVRVAGGRSTRYGMLRDPGLGKSQWPLYHIDTEGQVTEVGLLHALCGGHQGLWWLEGADHWPILKHREFKSGIFEDLPWFLLDKRPQGYLGRQFAHWAARTKGYPENPARWNSDQILWSLLEHGSDLSGAFILGDYGLKQFHELSSHLYPSDKNKRAEEYALYVQQLQQGEVIGTSAGGEQPKFVATRKEATRGKILQVIVKFSPQTDLPAGQRWSDLLIAEQQATNLLGKITGKPQKTTLLHSGKRVFLESLRFDRTGLRGRKAIVSLEALDGAFLGMNGSSWTDTASELLKQQLIRQEDADIIAFYWHFGNLIGNTDMHYGNLSFYLNPDAPLEVCPPYDMLPMFYAPSNNGEILSRQFHPKLPLPRERTIWLKAAEAAITFWQELSSNPLLSKEFIAIAKTHERAIIHIQSQVS